MGEMFQTRTLTSPITDEERSSIIRVVNEAFLEDAFFKVPEKRQRLKVSEDDPVGVESLDAILMQSEFIICESIDSNEIVGCIRVEVVNETTTSFGMLAVPEKFRSKGIGALLVREAEHWSLNRNRARIEILVVNIRAPVVDFYRKRGYEEFGLSPVDFDEMLGSRFLLDEYIGIVKFLWMGKTLVKV